MTESFDGSLEACDNQQNQIPLFKRVKICYPNSKVDDLYNVIITTSEINNNLVVIKGQTLALKETKYHNSLPENRIVVQRAWYNPMRFFIGKSYFRHEKIIPTGDCVMTHTSVSLQPETVYDIYSWKHIKAIVPTNTVFIFLDYK